MYIIRQFNRTANRPYTSRFESLDDAKELAQHIFERRGIIVAIETE